MWMLPTLSSQGRSRGSVLCSQHPFLWHPSVPFGLGTSLLVAGSSHPQATPTPQNPHRARASSYLPGRARVQLLPEANSPWGFERGAEALAPHGDEPVGPTGGKTRAAEQDVLGMLQHSPSSHTASLTLLLHLLLAMTFSPVFPRFSPPSVSVLLCLSLRSPPPSLPFRLSPYFPNAACHPCSASLLALLRAPSLAHHHGPYTLAGISQPSCTSCI